MRATSVRLKSPTHWPISSRSRQSAGTSTAAFCATAFHSTSASNRKAYGYGSPTSAAIQATTTSASGSRLVHLRALPHPQSHAGPETWTGPHQPRSRRAQRLAHHANGGTVFAGQWKDSRARSHRAGQTGAVARSKRQEPVRADPTHLTARCTQYPLVLRHGQIRNETGNRHGPWAAPSPTTQAKKHETMKPPASRTRQDHVPRPIRYSIALRKLP